MHVERGSVQSVYPSVAAPAMINDDLTVASSALPLETDIR